MSRIGKKVIEVPDSVSLNIGAGVVDIKGPKGKMAVSVHSDMPVSYTHLTLPTSDLV